MCILPFSIATVSASIPPVGFYNIALHITWYYKNLCLPENHRIIIYTVLSPSWGGVVDILLLGWSVMALRTLMCNLNTFADAAW